MNHLLNIFHVSRAAAFNTALAALLCLGFACGAVAAPVVSASIKPLQLIAAAITDGVVVPGLIFDQQQDPHHSALRPSSRRQLADADVLLWIGPALELPLVNIHAEQPGRLLGVQQLDGIVLHSVDGHIDPHVWLDTHNARLVADALTRALIVLDPANTARYAANQQRFAAALDALDAELVRELAAAESHRWAVYHHSLRYFERQFLLQSPLVLADHENNPPGMRSILALRDAVQQNALSCLLIEPGTDPVRVETLLGNRELPVLTFNAMGIDLEPDANAYVQMMRSLGNVMVDCLQGKP